MLPPRDEVRDRLVRLLEGIDTREKSDEWATAYVLSDEDSRAADPTGDAGVWKALLHLCGSDMKISDTEYLHGPNNFRAWLEEFDRSDPNRPQTSG
jgi:hypothetical protein